MLSLFSLPTTIKFRLYSLISLSPARNIWLFFSNMHFSPSRNQVATKNYRAREKRRHSFFHPACTLFFIDVFFEREVFFLHRPPKYSRAQTFCSAADKVRRKKSVLYVEAHRKGRKVRIGFSFPASFRRRRRIFLPRHQTVFYGSLWTHLRRRYRVLTLPWYISPSR